MQVETQVEDENEKGMISRRGAEFVLKDLSKQLGGALFQQVPFLWECIIHPLIDVYEKSKKGKLPLWK